MKQILVVGGGDGGTIFANEIAKKLGKLIKKGEVSITVLDRKDIHPFQPANLYVAFKGHDYKKYQKPEKDLLRKEVKFEVDPAEKIDVAERRVVTKSGKVYSYDYLVIATGSKTDYSEIPGLAEVNMDFHSDFESAAKIWKTLNSIKNGRLIFGVTDLTYKCPPSPMEGVLLADEFFRKQGIRDKVELTYISPLPRIYPIEAINEIIAPIFEERNIEFIPFFNIDSIDPEKRKYILWKVTNLTLIILS
ncbi:MAG: NAD(P)/FAD-dependent oxidoreductase [Candidatus Asgardarchaeia archaeon]